MILPPWVKPAAAGVLALGILTLGWTARGWYEDSQTLAEERGAQKVIDAEAARQGGVAAGVEKKLQDLLVQGRGLNRELQKLGERPVYRVECIDDDGLRLLQEVAGASGAADPAGEVRSAQPAKR